MVLFDEKRCFWVLFLFSVSLLVLLYSEKRKEAEKLRRRQIDEKPFFPSSFSFSLFLVVLFSKSRRKVEKKKRGRKGGWEEGLGEGEVAEVSCF